MNGYQDFEDKRLNYIKNILKKYFNNEKELQSIKNTQISNNESELNKMSIDKEIECIINGKIIDFKSILNNHLKIYANLNDHYKNGFPLEDFNIKNPKEKSSVNTIDTTTLKEIRENMIDCWIGKELPKERSDSMRKILREKKNYSLFSRVIGEFQNNGILTLKKNGYEKISEFLYNALDVIINNYDDPLPIYLEILSNTIYLDPNEIPIEETKGMRILVQYSIQTHPLWLKKDVWEIGIKNYIAIEISISSDSSITIYTKLKNLIKHMKSFNVPDTDISEIISHYITAYKVPSNLSNDLYEAIKTSKESDLLKNSFSEKVEKWLSALQNKIKDSSKTN